eukprot:scaffold36868_cov43-Prasinocladus_malaysianus.AAC.1
MKTSEGVITYGVWNHVSVSWNLGSMPITQWYVNGEALRLRSTLSWLTWLSAGGKQSTWWGYALRLRDRS